jgi:hypothetical protein
MKVYHGSYREIERIDLSKCKPRKDFGRGFYVTGFLEQAEFWAKRTGKEHNTEGYITEFEFDEFAYNDDDLQILRFDGYNEAWLDFVVANRSDTKGDNHSYDIVEGPVANDDVAQRIWVYLRGELPKEKFLEYLKFHRPTHQICFCTVESLQMLTRIPKTSESGMVGIDDAITQALITDFGMPESKAIDAYFSSNTYKHLVDESTGLYKKTWAEIYQLLLQELKISHRSA